MTIKKIRKSSSSEVRQNKPYDASAVFTTYDLGVSSALLCAGFELLSVEKTNPRKALFVFKKASGIEIAANKYFSDKLEVKARSFFDQLKALKNKLYNE